PSKSEEPWVQVGVGVVDPPPVQFSALGSARFASRLAGRAFSMIVWKYVLSAWKLSVPARVPLRAWKFPPVHAALLLAARAPALPKVMLIVPKVPSCVPVLSLADDRSVAIVNASPVSLKL